MITVENLSYTYDGTTSPAVQDLTFSINEGEILGFLGPSGAGKSTTQKVLIRLLQGYKGRAEVLGKSLDAWGYDYYEQIGVSFELPYHYSKLSALENLGYFASLYERETLEPGAVLKMVGLEEDGYTLVSQFSKGMKNRLSVARALLHQPDLLFLDEPTAGLDPVNARRIKELIKAQKDAGKTIFLTTHDMTVADQLCDRVAFIVDGHISLIDAPTDLKLQYGKADVRVEYGQNGTVESRDFALAGLAGNQSFLNLLEDGNVRTMHTQEASLESIFIEVTGRELA